MRKKSSSRSRASGPAAQPGNSELTWIKIAVGVFTLLVAGQAAALFLAEGPAWVRPAGIAVAVGAGLMAGLTFWKMRAAASSRRAARTSRRTAAEISREISRKFSELFAACQTLPLQPSPLSVQNRFAQICYDKFDCDQVTFMNVNHAAGRLEVVAAHGKLDTDPILGQSQELGEGVAGFVAESKKPLLLGADINEEKFWQFKEKMYPISAAMCVPVVYRDTVYGVINVTRRRDVQNFNQEELKMLQASAWYAGLSLDLLLARLAEAPRAKAA